MGVIVEDDMHPVRVLGEGVRTFVELVKLGVAVVVMEASGHRLARQVRLRITPVQTQVG